MSHLLDANALIALGWPLHEHHQRMVNWFKKHAEAGWATTAFTQGAFVRILSHPAFSGRAISISEIAGLLLRNTAHPRHRFIALDFQFGDVLGACTGGLRGHRQITDAWLLTAAMQQGMKLVTFDKGISDLLATDAERKQHLLFL